MTDSDDPIEALLRTSGRRPAVSAQRSARVREEVRAAWQTEVVRHRRRRRLVRGLAIAAALVLVTSAIRFFRNPAVPASAPIAVDRVVNAAWSERGRVPGFRSREELRAGAKLALGSTVRTTEDARAALRAPTGHSMRLDHGTTLRVVSDRSFFLERGAVYVDSGGERSSPTSSIRIETALGTIDEVGTQFEARLAAGVLAVRVREGEVAVRAGSRTARAAAGQALTVDGAGRIARLTAPAGAGWDWAEAVAPPFEIEGRSLADFLGWAAREQGVGVRFAAPDLAERASGIVLHGSIADMTLDQAISTVTATSGLVHRWEAGELVVDEAH